MKTTRRTFLAGVAVASVPAGDVVALAATPASLSHAAQENPELLAAYDRFVAARTEVAAAKEALEWLVDEWRHLWPLAPVEILGSVNGDQYNEHAERDIAGRIIMRDTAELRKRFTAKWVAEKSRVCCTVETPEILKGVIGRWEVPRTGTTANALARNRAYQAKVLSEYRHKLSLSEEYHAETARLREASGVDDVKRRVRTAKAGLGQACSDVSYEPAYTVAGLRLKADVLQTQDDGMAPYMRDKAGSLGAMARFIESTLDVVGRASA